MILLNMQTEDKTVAWSESKPKNNVKAASGYISPPASRNCGPESDYPGSCLSKRSISATILSLDNG